MSPGHYHGRVLEIPSKTSPDCIIMIQDQLLSLQIPDSNSIAQGDLISFFLDPDGNPHGIQTVSIKTQWDVSGDALRWRKPAQIPSRFQRLKLRHQMMRNIRHWFDQQDFIETETPLQVFAPNPEAQFNPVQTGSGFLVTSPEFQMKRLLVGGFERIYQFSRCFRDDECGRLHNPEFTLLEWYRIHQPLQRLTEDIEGFVLHIQEKMTLPLEKKIPPSPWQRITVSELFEQHLNILLDSTETADSLKRKAESQGFSACLKDLSNLKQVTEALAFEQVFFRLWDTFEHKLGMDVPVFVHDWPLPLASLARPCPDRPGFADRVELYANGIELANGFGELTDAEEQRKRFEQDLNNRESGGYETVPLDEKFLGSLEQGMPDSSGMALGVDRLMMWLTNVEHIKEVLCFSQDEL